MEYLTVINGLGVSLGLNLILALVMQFMSFKKSVPSASEAVKNLQLAQEQVEVAEVEIEKVRQALEGQLELLSEKA